MLAGSTASTAAASSSSHVGPSRDASDSAPSLPFFSAAPEGGSQDLAVSGSPLPDPYEGPATEEGSQSEAASPSRPALELELAHLPDIELPRLPRSKVLNFSDCELGECMSHGEFALVHRGSLHIPGEAPKDVVLKMLHWKDCMYDEQAAAELLSEISLIAELSHPRLVAFVGACLESPSRGGQLALVTELALGGNLHHALHVRKRQLSRRERFQLSTELLEGVRYLHARQPAIAHLDLKSMNLLLDREGQHLQICDFGLARKIPPPRAGGSEDGKQQRPPPNRGGSPRYMAPECYDSEIGPITEKADVWSSGCILIEIFGTCLPYASCSNVQQILKNMLVHHCGPAIPDCVEASVRNVITCTLAFEARDRQAIAQVLLQLQTLASSAENKSRFLWIP